MSKAFIVVLILFFSNRVAGQQLSQASFLNGSSLSYFSLLTDQGVLIRISDDGKVLEWGTEVVSDRGNYYAPRLQPYIGRVEYFGKESDSAFRGKIRGIGTAFITYYGGYEEDYKKGKLRSLGSLQFEYYSNYEDKNLQGKLKMMGSLLIDYYRSYENESFRGKPRAIGSVSIGYYSAFDDKYNAGKIKNIGSVNYVWYSPLNHSYLRGGLKTNNYRQVISGVTYILQ